MKYIVPSSKIVFTDLMILLVSLLMGLNSVMSFSLEAEETRLPPILIDPPAVSAVKDIGSTAAKRAFITIKSGQGGKRYFYNEQEAPPGRLIDIIRKANMATVVLRADRKESFEWQEFCQLTAQLMKAGVKEISYATKNKGGMKP